MHPFLFKEHKFYTWSFLSPSYQVQRYHAINMIDLFSLHLQVDVSNFPHFTKCVVFFSRTDPYVLQEQLIKDGAYYIVTPEGTVTWDEE